ncbi:MULTISPECIES: L,D-transpeptidase family protein [unclassified Moraxella]|uniref:L,D-transpeptidase family protein n=1 Tax=unclassified Moraxella TaxID=2685852 RepID=UPI003AF8CA19
MAKQPSNSKPCDTLIHIHIPSQTLTLTHHGQSNTYPISTAKNGVGELENTGCTPRGQHQISEKFGANLPINSVFVARQATGEIYNSQLAAAFPNRDWILSRILWLAGCEAGINQGTNEQGVCDTKARYIYIHGTPDSEPMGVPLSHGCIRMRNHDVIDLFDKVKVGTPVMIEN